MQKVSFEKRTFFVVPIPQRALEVVLYYLIHETVDVENFPGTSGAAPLVKFVRQTMWTDFILITQDCANLTCIRFLEIGSLSI